MNVVGTRQTDTPPLADPAALARTAALLERHDISGVRVPAASPAALGRTKDTCRPQDAMDRSFLQQILDRRQRT